MLKALIASLNNDGLVSDELRAQGLTHLIRDVEVYTMYSLKFEINRNNFKSWFKEHVKKDFFSSTDELNDYIDTIYKWYPHYLDNKTLVDKTTSLKSDAKKWFKKNKNKELKGFDRFYEETLRLFLEAYNVYDVVFYEPEAIKKNKEFSDDRKSCYINERPDYYDVIAQMNAFYIMIYRNEEPLTRLWGVLSTDGNDIVIFNSYGHRFKELTKFFGNKEEFETISQSTLGHILGIYVNEGTWLISKNADIDKFVYEVICPCCGNFTYSDTLEWVSGRLMCSNGCNGKVYSQYHDEWIYEDDAIYSRIHDDYFYKDDVVYSNWYDDYILYNEAVKVYNTETEDTDYVLKKDTVYSSYYDDYGYYEYLIADQAVYSEYYQTYLLKDDDETAFSNYLNSYIHIEDDDLVEVNGDYVPKKDCVFSEYYFEWFLKDQAVYSEYHKTYLPINREDIVFSVYLNTYVDKNSTKLVYFDGDYIPKEVLQNV